MIQWRMLKQTRLSIVVSRLNLPPSRNVRMTLKRMAMMRIVKRYRVDGCRPVMICHREGNVPIHCISNILSPHRKRNQYHRLSIPPVYQQPRAVAVVVMNH